jgi:protein TonB
MARLSLKELGDMDRRISLFAAVAILAQPAFAADQAQKAEKNRQLSEIVFQNYPPRALAAGEEGAVFFVVSLDKDAHPTSCEVTHGSGHPLLDAETCELIVQHAVFNSARDANGHVVKQTTEGVVNWTIPGHTPAPIKPILLTGNDKPEKQICKKNARMGTLSGVERICMTPTEWARQGDEMKQPYEDMQGKKGSTTELGCNGGVNCDDSTLGQFVNSHTRPPLR